MISSFITLVPKKEVPNTMSDFLPISLINCSFKVLSKLLTNRMTEVMDKLISNIQTWFRKGRQIIEGILITNEVVHSLLTKKCDGIIVKLDFVKTFESVDWEFLINTLEHMGFGKKWCSWIQSIRSTIRSYVHINGSPTSEFALQRGLRSGDSLSPFLFNIVGEVFSQFMRSAESSGLCQCMKVNADACRLSHLQFVDDTIISLEAKEVYVRNLKKVLQCLQLPFRLKINFEKSAIYSWHKDKKVLDQWVNILGCHKGSLPMYYLRVTIGG